MDLYANDSTPIGSPQPNDNVSSWLAFAQRPYDQGGLGLSPHAAAGVVGNLVQESGRGVPSWGPTGDSGTAWGAAQWRNERLRGLMNFAQANGMDYRSTEAQQAWMRHELSNSHSGAYVALMSANTPEQAANAFNRQYEISADRSGQRAANARALYGGAALPYTDDATSAAPAVQAVNAAATRTAGAQPYQGPNLSPLQRPSPTPSPETTNDPWAGYPDAPPGAPKAPSAPAGAAANGGDIWASYPDEPPKPSREIGTAEAAGRGFQNNIMLGAQPALAGASAAGNEEIKRAAKTPEEGKKAASGIDFLPGGTAAKTLYGAGKTLYDKFSSDQPTPATQAYDAKRAEEAKNNDEAYDQNKFAYGIGAVGGALLAPVPAIRAAKTGALLAQRIGEGVANGMIGGALFGGGHAIGEGKSAPEVASDTANGVAWGALLGGPLNGLLGKRPAGALTAADRAAQTAEQLGAPLPRGVVSNSPMIRATTAKMKEVPFGGEKIGEGVERTQAAAAKGVEDLATNLAGGAPTRTTAAPSASQSIRDMIDRNISDIDRLYGDVRNQINPDQHFPMPNLQNAIKDLELRRARAGWSDPGLGLEQVKNVANGVGHAGGFNGVMRLLKDLRDLGKVGQAPHQGYNVGDFKTLAGAAAEDLKNGVRATSTNPNLAASLFGIANMEAAPLIKIDQQLAQLATQKGEGIVGALVNSAREKSGNIALLREAKRTMSPAAFDQVAGVMLHELGLAEGQTGQFSLSTFATNWAKVSEQAKSTMFSPQHREWIENIVGLGNHLKDAGKFTNSAHTGSIILLLDVAKDAALLTHDLAQNGELGVGAAIGAGTSVAMPLLARWLASPKTAAPMSRFVTAYRALTLNQPSPARVSAFKVATRQLANNINVPYERIIDAARDRLSAQAAPPQEEQQPQVEGPRP